MAQKGNPFFILAVAGAVVTLLTCVSCGRPTVPEIAASGQDPYRPGDRVALSLVFDSRTEPTFDWSSPDKVTFVGGTGGRSAMVVVPNAGPFRVQCVVTLDGSKQVRLKVLNVSAPAPSATPLAGATVVPPIAPGTPTSGIPDVLNGVRVSSGLALGVDTSQRRQTWVTRSPDSTFMTLAFPGDPSWGAVFFTVGAPVDSNRPGWDYSGYAYLEIEMRGERGGESVEIGLKDATQLDNGLETKVAKTLGKDWAVYRVPLHDFAPADLRKLYVVSELVFATKPATIHVKRIRFGR
jgi:hypothetical protein